FSRDWSSDVCSSDLDDADKVRQADRYSSSAPQWVSKRKTSSQACLSALSVPMLQSRVHPVMPLPSLHCGVMTTSSPLRLSWPVRSEERRVGKRGHFG